MRKIVISLGVALASRPAVAHPGHGLDGAFGWAHFLTDPFHLMLIAAAVTATVLGGRLLRRRVLARRAASARGVRVR